MEAIIIIRKTPTPVKAAADGHRHPRSNGRLARLLSVEDQRITWAFIWGTCGATGCPAIKGGIFMHPPSFAMPCNILQTIWILKRKPSLRGEYLISAIIMRTALAFRSVDGLDGAEGAGLCICMRRSFGSSYCICPLIPVRRAFTSNALAAKYEQYRFGSRCFA